MKRFCIIISALIILASSAIGIETLKLRDTNSWYQFGEEGAIKVTIPAKDEIKEDIIYDAFLFISEQYNATIVKSNYNWNNSNLHIIKAVYINNEIETVSLINGRGLNKGDNNHSFFISTKQSDDTNQLGIIKDIFNDDYVEIMTLKRYKDMHLSLYGEYTVKLASTANIDACLNDLASYLNVSVDEITENVNFSSQVTNQTLSLLNSMQIILFISFVIGLFYYGIYQFKIIGIYKLNGISLDYIYYKLVRPIYIVQWVIALIIQIAVIFLIPYITKVIFVSVLLNSFKYLLVSLLATGVLYYLVSKVKISQLIKQENMSSNLVIINYLVKIIALCLLFYFFASSVVSLNNALQLKEKSERWKQYSDYVVVQYGESPDEKTRYFYNNLFKEENKSIVNNFFVELNNIGALYANTDELSAAVGYYSGKPIDNWNTIAGIEVTDSIKQLKLINYSVNPNMLDKLAVKNMEGSQIYVDQNEKDKIIIIPYSMEEKADDIVKLYQMDSVSDNEKVLSYKYIIYDDTKNNSFFSFNTMTDNIDIISPVFELLTNNNLQTGDLIMLFNTGINSPIKLPMNGKDLNECRIEMQKFYDLHLENKGGIQHFQTVTGVIGEEIEFSESQLNQSLYLIGIILSVYIFVILYFTMLYMKINIRKISVQKLNGYSLIESLKPYLKSVVFMDLVCYIIYIFSINYWFGLEAGANRYNLTIYPLVYLAGLVLIVIEIIIIYIFIKRIDRKAIIGYLKGDLYGND